jgi:cell division protease FtsH
MICEWGMSDAIGPINYSDAEETLFLGREVTKTRSHSEVTSVEIDVEVKKLLTDCYKRAELLIKDHRAEMERLAQGLLKYEVLSRAEVDGLIAGSTVDEVRRGEEAARTEPPAAAREETPPEGEKEPEPGPDDRDLESEGRFAY